MKKTLLLLFVTLPIGSLLTISSMASTPNIGGESTDGPRQWMKMGALGSMQQRFFPDQIAELEDGFAQFSSRCFGVPSLNFGVLVNNSTYQIYRSSALGESGTFQLFDHLTAHKLALPQRVIFMNKDGFRKPLLGHIPFLNRYILALDNFAYQEALVFGDEGEYPSTTFYHPLNAPVYLHGRNPLLENKSLAIAGFADLHSRELFANKSASQRESVEGGKDNLYYILELMLGEAGASLFHCTGGLHRTGMMALAIRHLQEGVWTAPFPEPIRVVIPGSFLAEIGLRNLSEVEYFLHNRYQARSENLRAIRSLARETRFMELRQRYQEALNEDSSCS